MELNTLRIVMTLISFAVFIGIIAWTLAPGNRAAFNAASMIPLADDEPLPNPVAGARHG